jgi:integrase
MAELRSLNSATALCLRIIILTRTRSSEARGARCLEIDDKAWVWFIPAAQMRANTNHDVPLNEEAMEILETMRKRRVKSNLVFPGATGGILWDVGLNKPLHNLPTVSRLDVEPRAKAGSL